MSAPVILVVDDNTLLQTVIVHLLKREGYQVIAWELGADVLAAIAYHRPALVVLDLELGAQSGVAIVERLRAAPPTVNLPIVVYSGNPFVLEPATPRLEALGCRLLEKPLRLDDMVRAVHGLIGRC